jgi:hypothetical protein
MLRREKGWVGWRVGSLGSRDEWGSRCEGGEVEGALLDFGGFWGAFIRRWSTVGVVLVVIVCEGNGVTRFSGLDQKGGGNSFPRAVIVVVVVSRRMESMRAR